jgi:superkiller protein 3
VLAAAVLALVLLAAGGVVWFQWQAEDRRRAVAAALEKADGLQRQARWAEARAVLEQAEGRLGEGGPEELRGRLERARRDLDLVARLDAIRLKRATLVEGWFDHAGADRDYAAAFREAGLGEVGQNPEDVAARVRASAVREELVTALDDWAFNLGRGERLRWVLAVARGADRDLWRDRVRLPRAWNNQRRLARLAREARAREGPPRFGAVLGMRLQSLRGEAEGLLRTVQRQRPGDFWVNFDLGNALQMKGKAGEAVGYFRAALAVRPDTSAVYNNLGIALYKQGKLAAAVREYRRALALDPKNTSAHNNLGIALKNQGKLAAAVRELRRALALDPKLALAYDNLGNALSAQGKLAAAVREYRRAIALDPKGASAHNNLGIALRNQGKLAAAVRELRRALALDPKFAKAHNNLGNALSAQGKLAAAVREYRRAIDLDPKYAKAHNNLGIALQDQGKLAAAVRELRRAIALDPKYAPAYYNLGNALVAQGKRAEAVKEFCRALALDPKYAMAHYNLGVALYAQGKRAEAMREYRRAIALDPKYAPAHYNLGNALVAQAKLVEAAREYRKAIALNADFAEAHCNLGQALQRRGKFAEALAALKQGHVLGSKKPGWRYPSAQWVRAAQRLVDLDAKLPRVLQGIEKPRHAAECMDYAHLCMLKRLHAAAARFFTDAFGAQPKFADDLAAGHRYTAACVAVLAATGQGIDADKLAEKEKAVLRGKALTWLKADLALWGKRLEGGQPLDRPAATKMLQHWQQDPDLAGVRDPKALARLPEAERKEWAKLWAEVGALLKKAGPKP